MDEFRISVLVRAEGDVRSRYAITEEGLAEEEPLEDSSDPKSDPDEGGRKTRRNRRTVNSHILEIKPFLDALASSRRRRKLAISYFARKNAKNCRDYTICIDTDLAGSYAIDYAWGLMLWRECHMMLERECAAAWLSTLGGGFSALGDYSSKYAARALQTSLRQLWLAKMCDDDSGVARGLLFLALALSQLGLHRLARDLLLRAWRHPSYDPKHRNMCLGVEAKLRYDRKQSRLAESKVDKMALWNSIKTISIV